jgi:hypothetical protein
MNRFWMPVAAMDFSARAFLILGFIGAGVFFFHHSEWSGAVPKTFFKILSLSREAGADRGWHFVRNCCLTRMALN